MTRSLRPYRPEDRAAAQAVYYRAIMEGAAAHYSLAERQAWAGAPAPDLTKPDKLADQWCYVAEDDGLLTGFMSMATTGYLDMAFVLPEVMGDGTAAALYELVLARARAGRVPRLTVHAAHQSQRFLSRRGWQVDQFRRHADKGQVYDQFLMSLALEPVT